MHIPQGGRPLEAEDDLLAISDGRKVCLWSLSALLPFLSAVQREHARAR